MQKIIIVPDIGKVIITKKTNASRVKLRVHPEKGVLITIPYYAKFKEGEDFLYKNLKWLHEMLNKLSEKKNDSLFKPGTVFVTNNLKLQFITHNKSAIAAKLEFGFINIYYNPEYSNFEDERVQKFIKRFILLCLKNEGQKYLPNRLDALSKKSGLKYRSVKIGTAGTRLGSCNSRNDIMLSARLMLLPENLIDYIILHELCHIVHKNHGDKFHSLLNQLTDGHSDELNKRLKKSRIEITPGVYC
ncbi:MAG TPA: SprT family zinc-dependent metalloprotease [Bacteroidales bacterium]|nr:SprT family zinc-dependent metalloprotease [Bacteroidales bacterium]